MSHRRRCRRRSFAFLLVLPGLAVPAALAGCRSPAAETPFPGEYYEGREAPPQATPRRSRPPGEAPASPAEAPGAVLSPPESAPTEPPVTWRASPAPEGAAPSGDAPAATPPADAPAPPSEAPR